MRQTRIIQPDYAERFRCLGSECEDTCCSGWQVPLDEADYDNLTSVPDGSLRSLVRDSILRTEGREGGQESPFAVFRMLPSGECPLLSPDKLCRIHKQCGEQYLARICAVYPRHFYRIDGQSETELSLSCPEAARLILLSPSLISGGSAASRQLTWDETASRGANLRPYFWQIREAAVSLILNRTYPLWQRLFLLGMFCRRLEAFSRGEIDRRFVDLLDDFTRAVATPGLRESMQTIPADIPLQVEIVLMLVMERLKGDRLSQRARDILDLFDRAVVQTPTASIESQASRYAEAYRRDFTRFFGSHPRVLENLLLNAVFRDAFPFGKTLTPAGGDPEPAKAFAMLTIQFVLIKGLLIGVAGARGSRFASADVVQAVQTASRLFEHTQFLRSAYRLLEERGVADARGLTMLIRN
ncbi:flagellin lysine-N-methylase [Occallatibacter riparius]|uniref:Flagellin lysine-N-methylase n=1 Tax=Occallatibacter riparius TaxID=1002689 RepID=A0A9J7BKV2_9BACT|nr:flagellin lysine-N-methylase [Occallatibacter riparius]UWZ83235.1 flagellin lysine-N-methylase [Occallatibacter riparius]